MTNNTEVAPKVPDVAKNSSQHQSTQSVKPTTDFSNMFFRVWLVLAYVGLQIRKVCYDIYVWALIQYIKLFRMNVGGNVFEVTLSIEEPSEVLMAMFNRVTTGACVWEMELTEINPHQAYITGIYGLFLSKLEEISFTRLQQFATAMGQPNNIELCLSIPDIGLLGRTVKIDLVGRRIEGQKLVDDGLILDRKMLCS